MSRIVAVPRQSAKIDQGRVSAATPQKRDVALRSLNVVGVSLKDWNVLMLRLHSKRRQDLQLWRETNQAYLLLVLRS